MIAVCHMFPLPWDCYDAAGNQITEDTDDIYRARYYDGLNQLTWEDVSDYVLYEDRSISYASDGRGNVTSALDTDDTGGMLYYYNADGTMSGMSHRPGRGTGGWRLSQSMKYDHNGIRTEKTVGGQKTDHYYAEGKPIVFASASHTQTNIFDGQEIIGAYHGSTWYDYLTDQQGSTMGILKQDGTTAAAYSYSDFGETTARYGETFNNEICYTGAVYDNDFGEYYLNARYYDPATANFLSQDTYRGDTGDYGQWILYAYCANDPVNHYDSSGHWVYSLGIEAKAGVIIGVYAALAVNVDSSGFACLTGTAGGLIVTGITVSLGGYFAGYQKYNSVDELKGFGISMGFDFGNAFTIMKGKDGGLGGGVTIAANGKMSATETVTWDCWSPNIMESIPKYEVKAGYTIKSKNINLKKMFKWKNGKKKSMSIGGLSVKMKRTKKNLRLKSIKRLGDYYINPDKKKAKAKSIKVKRD